MASTLQVNEIKHTGGTSAMTLSSAGVVTEPTKPSWKISMSAQTLTGSTWTLMNANSAVYNIGNHYNSNTKTFTAPVAGTYYIYGQWFGSVSSNRGIVAFYKNGSRFFESLTVGSTANGGISYQGCTTVQCAATDTLQWYGYHEQGSGVAVNTNSNLSHWGGFLIG